MATYRFDRFVIDSTGELRREGSRVAIAPKVAELLLALVESGGRLVTRAELQERLWPDTHTDRDRGLNNAMNRLREALGDSAAEPRFVETVPKRGYRFLARIETSEARVSRRPDAFLVTAAIAAVMLVAIGLPKRYAAEPPAPAEYWAALRKRQVGSTRDLTSARDLLNIAIERSPGYAPAYAALTGVLLDLVDSGAMPAGETRRLAGEKARAALRLAPDSSDAHLALGSALMRGEWRLNPADDEIREALRLNPNSAEAWRARASLLLARGDARRAVQAAERSVALDPLSPWVQTAKGRAIFYQGDNQRSAEQLERAVRIAPEFSPAHRYLSEVYWKSGRREDARREFMAAMRLGGLVTSADLDEIDALIAREGLPGYWRSQLASLHARIGNYGVPFKLGSLYAAMDQREEALRCLEKSIEQRDTQCLFLRVHPWFDNLRADARFQSLLKKIPTS